MLSPSNCTTTTSVTSPASRSAGCQAESAADHYRHLVDERVRYHCGDGFIGTVRGEFCVQMLVSNVVKFLLIGR
jgi:hypothetical protein